MLDVETPQPERPAWLTAHPPGGNVNNSTGTGMSAFADQNQMLSDGWRFQGPLLSSLGYLTNGPWRPSGGRWVLPTI